MAALARVLGDEQAAATYQDKADKTHRAVQRELWSDEFAMLGPKGPLGILRLHPQSLEIEMPVWTGLVDPYQAEALLDWSSANLEFRDEAGGRWMYDNDWWPAVWSQHVPAEGDAMMVGWAHMLGGRHDVGNDILRTFADASIRSPSPGFDYLFASSGQGGGADWATAQGAFVRALVEGTFGVSPAIDQQHITLRPHFPADWDHARFLRPGLDFTWDRQGTTQRVLVKTAPDIRSTLELSVDSPVVGVTLDGKGQGVDIQPAMHWGIVRVDLPRGGGQVIVRTEGEPARFDVPEEATVGQPVRIGVNGVDRFQVVDRFGMVDVVSASAEMVTVRPRRPGAGRCLFFLDCARGNLRWIEPIALHVGPRRAVEAVERTVADPLPPGTRLVPIDLSAAYTDDIQTARAEFGYWSWPRWVPSRECPTRVRVGEIPFLIGPMGPGDGAKAKDLIMIANMLAPTWQWDCQYSPPPPDQAKSDAPDSPDPTPKMFASGMRIRVGRRLHKFYLLSLNMNLPQKCYVPAVEVVVRYENGNAQTTFLVPPLNFDSSYQDFGINTMAMPLPIASKRSETWPVPFGYDLRELHLTMTDVLCDPARTVESVELRAIATETLFGLAGLTLAEVTDP